jgi:hypothetical protein
MNAITPTKNRVIRSESPAPSMDAPLSRQNRHGACRNPIHIGEQRHASISDAVGQACGFERYLKSGSGHAFAKRHFWNPES